MALAMPQAMDRSPATPTINARLPARNPTNVALPAALARRAVWLVALLRSSCRSSRSPAAYWFEIRSRLLVECAPKLFAATVAKIHLRGKRDGAQEFDILAKRLALFSSTMDMIGGRKQEA